MTTLRHGDRSQAVQQLQKALNAKGAKLVADGDFGDVTEAAVRDFQLRVGLVDDGVAGDKTQLALQGGDCTRLLKSADLIAAAKRLGVEVAAVYAVNEVESAGMGFLCTGKPAVLFERHVMYRQLSTPRNPGDNAQQLEEHANALAVQYPSLVNPKAGGYAGGTAEHQRLASARLIDDLCALESTSWGAFQIMGYHWQELGYESVYDLVACMSANESQQLEAFVRFIEADPALHKALKARKWTDFAKRYNGPAYARNLYDVKLERAYKRHSDCGCGIKAA
jgi:hypothetical protein